MKGVVGVSFWNLIIVGLIALVAVYLFNRFAAGKTVAGMTVPRV